MGHVAVVMKKVFDQLSVLAVPNVAECVVAKNRHGETTTVKLRWLPQYTTFSDLEWKHQL